MEARQISQNRGKKELKRKTDDPNYYLKWQRNNRNKVNKNSREWREKNPNYNKNYWKEHSNKIFIYFLEGNEKLYIGLTNRIYRATDHLYGRGQSKKERCIQPEIWIDNKIQKLKYIDITDIVRSEEEAKYLEALYINRENPKFNRTNRKLKGIYDLTAERQAELDSLIHNNKLEFIKKEVKIVSEEQGKIKFNDDDLRLR